MRIVFGILEVLTMSMSTIKGISKDIVVLCCSTLFDWMPKKVGESRQVGRRCTSMHLCADPCGAPRA